MSIRVLNLLLTVTLQLLLVLESSNCHIHVPVSDTAPACNQSDIQLVGGERNFEGRVEVCDDGEWKVVCNDGWYNNKARVVCRQLGYPEDTRTYWVRHAWFGNANPSQSIMKVIWDCEGSEQQLLDCPVRNSTSGCDRWNLGGVRCFGRNPDYCSDDEIRLNGSDFSGRVEVCLDKFWGTVCDDGWDIRDATTVCRELGLSERGIPTRGAYFGEGSGPIHLSKAQCGSSDDRLIDCTIDKTGINGCDHSEDAGVICEGMTDCQDWNVRLVGAENEREGRVEICYNGVWGTVCGNGWQEADASVVCSQLGYGLPAVPLTHFGAGDGPMLLQNIACNKSHSNISQCVRPVDIGIHKCDRYNTAGVMCPNLTVSPNKSVESETVNTSSKPTVTVSSNKPTVSSNRLHQSVLFGTVGAALAVVIIIVFVGLVLVAVVVVTRRKKKKDVTRKGAMDNPVYDENISFGPPSGINQSNDDPERDFQNPLYSAVGPTSPNTTNKPGQNNTAESLGYSDGGVVTESPYDMPCNCISEGQAVYDMPLALDSVNADGDKDTCYSSLGPTGSSQASFKHQEQLPTGDDSDYSRLQHK